MRRIGAFHKGIDRKVVARLHPREVGSQRVFQRDRALERLAIRSVPVHLDAVGGQDRLLLRQAAGLLVPIQEDRPLAGGDRKSTRLNSSHRYISYAVFCLEKKKKQPRRYTSDYSS